MLAPACILACCFGELYSRMPKPAITKIAPRRHSQENTRWLIVASQIKDNGIVIMPPHTRYERSRPAHSERLQYGENSGQCSTHDEQEEPHSVSGNPSGSTNASMGHTASTKLPTTQTGIVINPHKPVRVKSVDASIAPSPTSTQYATWYPDTMIVALSTNAQARKLEF